MVDALLEELTPQSLTPGAFTQPNLKAGVMIWIGGWVDDDPHGGWDQVLVPNPTE